MKDFPLVSVIMPLYNRVHLVGETINSVIHQTYENWELLIVDDGSTDGSYEYAKAIAVQDSRVRICKRDCSPKGAPTCRNIGLNKSEGDYIIFLDSDDLFASQCFEQRVQAAQQYPDRDFLVFPIKYFEYQVGDRNDIFFRYFYQDYITSFLLKSHWITMSPIWKREALVRLKGFDEQLACMQDSDLHLRALLEGMQFKVFRDPSLVDGYLRDSNHYSRISNNLTAHKLDSKVAANRKMFVLLSEKKMLTPIRTRMIAAHFLNISWNYRLLGEEKKAQQLWLEAYQKEMINRRSYQIGKSFIAVRNNHIIKKSRLLSGIVKRIYQTFLPQFLLYL
ncbi:MAG: glycosyltransferase family 2 protein [Bacteroidota bacterium]